MLEYMIKTRMVENNQVLIIGQIHTGFTFSHEVMGEGFYRMEILTWRLSGRVDRIPVMISERLIDISKNYIGEYIKINGQVRSCNIHEGEHSKRGLFVFAREVEGAERKEKNSNNEIYLDGNICKAPVYRITPMGREIAEIIIAVNRPYERSDYIPCICWGRNAKYSSGFKIGDRVQIHGRIQSREYIKHIEDGKEEKKTTYEISVSHIKKKDNEIRNIAKVCDF